MSISVTDRKVTYAGNGATTRWPLTFPLLEASHIGVIITNADGLDTTLATNEFQVLPTLDYVDYPLPGGTVLPTGWKITLVRTVPYTQETDLGTRWPFDSIENMSDKLTMQVQQLAEEVGRSVKVGMTSTVSPDQLITEIRAGAATAIIKAGEASASATQASSSQTAAAESAVQAAASAASAAEEAANNVAALLDQKIQTAETAKAGAQAAQTEAEIAEANVQNSYKQIGALVGHTGYIAEGLKITADDGLNVSISTGRASIDEKIVSLVAAQSLTLEQRKAVLLYLSSAGVVGKINAVSPLTFIDDNTVAMWIFNQTTAGASIPNSAVGLSSIAVANDSVPSGGLTSVDGWCDYAIQGNGTNGYYVSQNSIGFPIGASEREWGMLYTCNSITTTETILCTGATTTFELTVYSGAVKVNVTAATVDTGFVFEVGKTYYITWGVDAAGHYIKINGAKVFSESRVLNTTATVVNILRRESGVNFGKGTIHFIELRNKMRTPQEIAQMANKLLLPNFYSDTDGTRKDIREILPTDSIALAFARTSSTAVTEVNTTDYKYGRREGAVGGNRRVFCNPGWQAFSGAATLFWDNPFGTRKIKTKYVWTQDTIGTNESNTAAKWANGSSGNPYGILTNPNATTCLRITTEPYGVAYFNGVWQTSGYIGCYAEVLEDD